MNQTVSVFATSDNNYAPYAATTIASVMMHTSAYVKFYIIDCGISEEYKFRIKKEEHYFTRLHIEFVKIDANRIFAKFPVMTHLSMAMYGKYLITNLKPDIKRIIYTDIDVSFTGDILELWNENLDGMIMGAVPSQRHSINNNYYDLKTELGISQEHVYFMSGLMLIDCEKWRKKNITESLLNTTIQLQKMPDQEVLNVIFSPNHYKILDVKYCVIYKIFKECYTPDQIREYVTNQIIIHYPGGGTSKPWNNRFLKSAKYFNKSLKYTDFQKEIEKNQWRFMIGRIINKVLRNR